jgi:hypothetical protein
MTANTPGSSLTERVDQRTVLPVRVETFTGHKKTEDMPGGWVGDKGGVVVEPNKNGNRGEI